MLATGTILGPFKILSPLGTGGMGEVYRARDTRLSRDVALKVIHAEVARDPDRIKRFEQEARAAGALNHPNVCTIYDLGMHEGSPYVAMELLEGESLRERLMRGPLPWKKALEVVQQVALGLAAAHAKGIIHRDLNPENLFVTKDGRVKVLDFGLAKLTRPDVVAAAGEPTISIAATETGAILGTVGYMSPEQVRGENADARSDVFAVGAILYELVTGRRAYRGATYVETLNAILNSEPEALAGAQPEVPAAVESLVRRCLEKEAGERYQGAQDLAYAVELAQTASGVLPAVAVQRAPRRAWLWLAPSLVLGVALGIGIWALTHPAPPVPTYQRVTFRRGTVSSARFTPDGQSVVYSARYVGEQGGLYVQRLGTPDARPLGVGGGVVGIVGGEVAILRGGTLARMSLEGGTPRDLAKDIQSADWGADGTKSAVVRVVDDRIQLECPIGKVLVKAKSQFPTILGARLSPAGDRVAYVWCPLWTELAGDLVVVDLAGHPRVLAKGWAEIQGFVWSPDGREVWFTGVKTQGVKALYAVALDGKERLVARMPGDLQVCDIARDGRVLLVQNQIRWEVRGRMAGDASERDYSWLDGTLTPYLTPDGKGMVFQEWGEGGGAYSSAYLRRADGSAPVRLADGFPGLGLTRFRGQFPKGGYDVRHGQERWSPHAASVQRGLPGGGGTARPG